MSDRETTKTGPLTGLKKGLGGGARRLGSWVKRHRLACVLILAAVAVAAFWGFGRLRAAQPAAAGYSFIRTTTLQKSSLENSVSATGTVASSDVSNVTTSLKYAVKEVFVQVGIRCRPGT